MIRTLVILAAVSFVLTVVCFAAAFAIVGGPFYIDDEGRFHREMWTDVNIVRVHPAPALLKHC
jgi:hypothetical protein